MFFTRYFFKLIEGKKFEINYHHDDIIQELNNVSNYKTLFLNINIPPRYTKTLLAAIMFISWSLARNPKANFIYITGSDKLANETSSKILKIINHPDFISMFGVKLAKDQQRKDLWRTDAGGGLMCSTIFGQITGFGAGIFANKFDDQNRPFEGAIILDDLNKINDAVKQSANNQKVNDILFNTVIPSRLNSADTPVINIQQRSGPDDATKNLNDYFSLHPKDKVKSLLFPVIYKGKPLWPAKHSLSDIEIIRKHPLTAYTFESQYMQNPQDPKGLVFPPDSLQYFELDKLNRDNFIANISYIDTADAGDDDYSQPFADIIGNRLYIVDVIFNKEILSINKGRTVQKIKQHNTINTTVETNKEGTFYKTTLESELPGHTILGIFNISNKHVRIISYEEFIKKYCVFRSDYEINSEYHMFMKNLTEYRKDGSSKHDDAPDSLAGLANYAFYNFGVYLK